MGSTSVRDDMRGIHFEVLVVGMKGVFQPTKIGEHCRAPAAGAALSREAGYCLFVGRQRIIKTLRLTLYLSQVQPQAGLFRILHARLPALLGSFF
jgi:hypothetical protein